MSSGKDKKEIKIPPPTRQQSGDAEVPHSSLILQKDNLGIPFPASSYKPGESAKPPSSARQPSNTHPTTGTNPTKSNQINMPPMSDKSMESNADIQALLKSLKLDDDQIKAIKGIIKDYHKAEYDEFEKQREELDREKKVVGKGSNKDHSAALDDMQNDPLLTTDFNAWRSISDYNEQVRLLSNKIKALRGMPGIVSELKAKHMYWQQRAQEFEETNEKLKAENAKMKAALQKAQQKVR